jgi:hypothetical protein
LFAQYQAAACGEMNFEPLSLEKYLPEREREVIELRATVTKQQQHIGALEFSNDVIIQRVNAHCSPIFS